MALFTESEAKACKISSLERLEKNSNYVWRVGIFDDNNIPYIIEFNNLGEDPSKSDLKSAVVSELLDREKSVLHNKTTKVNYDEDSGKGIGETLA